MQGIYKITNNVNGKSYVGQSVNIESRWKRHKRGGHKDYPLYRAFNKYGLTNFQFEVLEECKKESLNEREQYYIDYFNTLCPNGYNQVKVEQRGVVLTPSIIIDIIKELKTNTTNSTEEIGKQFQISGRTIRSINRGDTWYDEQLNYPIRTRKIKKNYCKNCGIEIGSTSVHCVSCAHKSLQKCERPDRETLKKEIRTLPFTQIGTKYGVSDNAIRKWCVSEKLPKTVKEIKSYSEKDWDLI